MALLLLVGFGLPIAVVPAHAAAEDVITNLGVRYEIRPDGSVGVTYRLDYRFGETGRRGILFAIIAKEPFGDGLHNARYDIRNVAVDSPSGAPDTFEQTVQTKGDTEEISLRVGDADKPLSTRTASYVITYDMSGGLETHDDYAELYRDVTTDYPLVERYSVEVSAPGGVAETRCAAGSTECTTAIEQGTARYGGSNLAPGEQLTIAAKVDPARVANAHPHLELQSIDTPRTLAVAATTTLRPDGVVTVRQATRYRFPATGGEVTYAIPTRRPFSDTADQLFEVDRIVVTDETGARIATRERVRGEGRSTQALLVTAAPDPGTLSAEGVTTLTLDYEVRNAFRADQDNAQQLQFRWPLVLERAARFTEVTAEYRSAGTLASLGCEIGGTREQCDIPAAEVVDGTGVFRLPRDVAAELDPDRQQVVVTVPVAAVGNPQPVLGESIDRREARRMGASFLTTVGLMGALITGGVVLSRRQAFANLRYAGVPPGVLNRGGAVEVDEKLQVPVRFEPPETDLATAGRLLDGAYHDRHTTAEIVDAAVRGVVRIQMKPFTLWAGRNQQLPPQWSTWFDPVVKRFVRGAGGGMTPLPAGLSGTTPADLVAMTAAVRQHQPTPQAPRGLLRSPEEVNQLRRKRWGRAWLAFGVLVVLLIGLRWALMPILGGWVNGLLLFGIVAAAVATSLWRRRTGRIPTSADGTALLDQVVGFRTYLTTAEAHQLRFEAGEDIYSRYLPWAVLFDIVDKWTATCQQLAAQGAIPPLRTAWTDQPVRALGSMTLIMDRELSRSEQAVRAAAAAAGRRSGSSSGTGGRSAFSSRGFSSGGGGGGTSTSSW